MYVCIIYNPRLFFGGVLFLDKACAIILLFYIVALGQLSPQYCSRVPSLHTFVVSRYCTNGLLSRGFAHLVSNNWQIAHSHPSNLVHPFFVKGVSTTHFWYENPSFHLHGQCLGQGLCVHAAFIQAYFLGLVHCSRVRVPGTTFQAHCQINMDMENDRQTFPIFSFIGGQSNPIVLVEMFTYGIRITLTCFVQSP